MFRVKRVQRKKKGRPSHHPNIAYLNLSKYVVKLLDRKGSISNGNRVTEVVKVKGWMTVDF